MGNNQPWKCDACTCENPSDQNVCKQCICERLIIPIKLTDHHFNTKTLSMPTSYSYSITIEQILDKAISFINKNQHPKVYYIERVDKNSFTQKEIWYSSKKDWNNLCITPLNNYNINNITTRGLHIQIAIKYIHKVNKNSMTCKYIKNNEENKENNAYTALQCPIYQSMKVQYQFSEQGLNHLCEFTHFEDEFNEKTVCIYDQNCKAFIRLEKGGNKIDDRCHIKIYKHPPRNNRQIHLSQNIAQFLINTDMTQNHPIYSPTLDDGQKYDVTDYEMIASETAEDGYIEALIEEVINNGYKSDLCLQCTTSDECKHDNYSILKIIDQKMNHIRHKQMDNPLRRDHMLALLLYTGCDCNYDLCKSQRNKNYDKWKWFDYCLYHAIKELSNNETGSYKLYSGLNRVKLNKKQINGSFPTYTSTSWSREVAMKFMGDKGMILEIDKAVRDIFLCCDVSWISKFPDECEILIARSGDHWSDNKFVVTILDETKSIQTVLLTVKQS